MIRHLLFTLLCGIALANLAYAKDTNILILGDSLSAAHGIEKDAGWVNLLQQKLLSEQYPYTLINASISGETSGGGLARLTPLLKQYQPQLLIIELGANDGLRGFPLKELSGNLNAIIKMARQHKVAVLLIGVQIPLNYGPRYTQLFTQVFTDAASANKLPLLPSLLGDIPLKVELMQSDGLHPNATAQPLIFERVWPALLPLLKKPS